MIAQRLMPTLGYGWTVRIMGFIVLFNSGVMLALVRQRFPASAKRRHAEIVAGTSASEKQVVVARDGEGAVAKRTRRTTMRREKLGAFFEWSAFRREPPYTLFCAGMFCVWLALYFAFYYVSCVLTQPGNTSQLASLCRLCIFQSTSRRPMNQTLTLTPFSPKQVTPLEPISALTPRPCYTCSSL